jgi:hypothetical protein
MADRRVHPHVAVLLALASYADRHTGKARPSIRRLCADLGGLAVGTVHEHLAALVALGVVDVVVPGGGSRATTYRMGWHEGAVVFGRAEHNGPVDNVRALALVRPGRVSCSAGPNGSDQEQMTYICRDTHARGDELEDWQQPIDRQPLTAIRAIVDDAIGHPWEEP